MTINLLHWRSFGSRATSAPQPLWHQPTGKQPLCRLAHSLREGESSSSPHIKKNIYFTKSGWSEGETAQIQETENLIW